MSQRRFAWMALMVVAVGLLSVGCRAESEAAIEVQRVPDFRLPVVGGGEAGPSDYSGKVLLLEFWATWCTPCRAQAQILDRLYEGLDSEEIEFLAVSVGEPPAVVESFVERHPFPYPVLLDSQDQLSGHLMIYVLPTITIVDREGRIVYFEMGISSEGKLRKALEDALRSEAAA